MLPDPTHPPLSDAGLAALAKLPRFRNLEAYEYDNVSDAGLAHLKGMAGIEQLQLSDEPITDAGLAHRRHFALSAPSRSATLLSRTQDWRICVA